MTPVAKSIIAIFLVALIGTAGYLYAVKSTSKPSVGAERPKITEITQSAGAVFQSKLVDLGFTYPKTSDYREVNFFAKREQAKGKYILFQDKNGLLPTFRAVTDDFEYKDAPGFDFIEGSLDSLSSFDVTFTHRQFTQKKELEPGMFLIAGYDHPLGLSNGNVPVSLVVRSSAPGIKYVSFDVGLLYPETPSESSDPDDAEIQRTVTLGMDEHNPEFGQYLEQSLRIARTFTSKNQGQVSMSTSGWKTFTNTDYGYTLQAPNDWTVDDTDKRFFSLSSPARADMTAKLTMGPPVDGLKYLGVGVTYYESLQDFGNGTKTTLEEALKGDLYSNVEPAAIGTEVGFTYRGGGCNAGCGLSYVVEHKQHLYEINFPILDEENLNDVGKAILDSFKFTH